MLKSQRHIISLLCMVAITCTNAFGQTLEEDFDHSNVGTLIGNCWIYDDFHISSNDPINSGGAAPHGEAEQDQLFDGDSYVSSPFIYFDGTETITFKHKAEDDVFGSFSAGALYVNLISPTDNSIPIFSHTYSDDVVHSESVNVAVTGYYRVSWVWIDFNCQTNYFIDDIVIPEDTNSFVEVASDICFGESEVYSPSDAVEDYYTFFGFTFYYPYYFDYQWSWVGTPGGVITTQTSNDREASVEWNVGPGDYRLKVQETYTNGGCNGRVTYIDVKVLELPEFDVIFDTVCEGEQATMTFTGTAGVAPYTITYDDGSGTQTVTTSGNSESYLLNADATAVDIISVEDDNGCDADAALLMAYPIYYHPKPSTDPIYHF